jgi:hypothetical protein
VPTGSGRARDLSRRSTPRTPAAETGRRHHIGAVPELMPVMRPDGTVAMSRTTPVQLADRTPLQLVRLEGRIEAEMRTAAESLDFETAAFLRDELAAVRAEQARR